ncbi:MAG: response regulator transcription factor [Erysipelotrichaceae bacterium]|nr:response regulator transcription factor [Erysipelotrichaceae bacterium]
MAKILIVDDELKIREVIKEYGKSYGYTVKEASNGKIAVDMVDKENFDVIVLDIMMPELDGFSACKQIKAKKPNIPVIMLSARQEEYDKLFGFDLGIDDYVTKPFSPKELMARIKVVLERRKDVTVNALEFKELKINETAHEVTINDEVVKLTNKEFELLVYLLKHRNVALSRERLLDDIWGYDFYGDERTIDTHIKMLRQSIKEYGDYIKTVRGVGYKFHAE